MSTRPPVAFDPAPFEPHPLFRHAHLQTVVGEVVPRDFARHHAPWLASARTEQFTLADGDRLQAVLHLHPDDPARLRPVVLHLHGLEGSAEASYQKGISTKAYAAGFHSVRLNFRNCGDTEHLARALYHGRSTDDVLAVLAALREEWGFSTLYATGASLGANLLLRLLADAGQAPPPGLAGVVAVSPPVDMAMTAAALDRGFNRGYTAYFLGLLKRKMRRKQRLSPGGEGLSELVRELGRVHTLRAFDELVTAPLSGYPDAATYYAHASSGDDLHRVRVPTLLIHAQDDPFLPYAMYGPRMEAIAANPYLVSVFPDHGGHVGFLMPKGRPGRRPWMDEWWAENEAIAYLQALHEAR
ncbi:MAG TPA: alpha/beta fold hydrolase [Pantanalinema sp.]